MSHPYTPWVPDSLSYSQHLQLEHEYDLTPAPSDNLHSQQHQHQHAFPDSYQHPQAQFPSDNFTASNFVSNQSPHSRNVSFGSNGASFPVHGIYGSSHALHQNQPAVNPTASFVTHSIPEQQRPYHNNAASYSLQVNSSPTPLTATSLSTINSSASAAFPSTSPDSTQDGFSFPQSETPLFHQHQQFTSGPSLAESGSVPNPQGKRRRMPDQADDGRDDDDDPETGAESKTTVKAKAGGACARCKNLKVKCELKTDTDPCKRCFNAGQECITPGRKKRRTPPKREHLLNQIREQAAQIQKLMTQLETVNTRQNSPSTTSEIARTHTPDDLHSPVLSPSSTGTSFFGSDASHQIPNSDAKLGATKVVEDWIAKAKESLAEFDGLIGIGGAGMPKSYLVDEDQEDSDGSWDGVGDIDDEGNYKADGEYEFVVEDSRVDDVHEEDKTETSMRKRSSMSSLNTNATGPVSGLPTKKHSSGSEKLATVPNEAIPWGLMASLSLKKYRASSEEPSGDGADASGLGVVNVDFFRPNPSRAVPVAGLHQQAPHILTRGIVTPQEAEKLFAIYFSRMNLSLSLLDPELYTAPKTCYRSPFLFTVICAIASRYYTERPELYGEAMHFAQLAAGTALISGHKTVEVCQGYILLSLYPVPARRWDEDRSWLYLGLAIRVATDLNLHHPSTAKPLNETHEREMLNRTRVWLNCFNLDRSMGSQYGKAPIINNKDYIANRSEDWWQSSQYNLKNFDIHLCAYNAELKVMGAFMQKIYSNPQTPTGLNRDVNIGQIAEETDDELKRLGDKWFAHLDQTDMSDPQNCFRTGILRIAYNYARLVALSYGLQYAFGKNVTNEDLLVARCLAAATDVVNTVVDNVGRPSQRVYLRHGPEAQSVFVTFASAFLVKLLQPKFAAHLTKKKRLEIRGLVNKVIDLLGSPEVAIDDRHGPKLYSLFLKGLLATPLARVSSQSPNGLDHTKNLPHQPTKRTKSPSNQSFESTMEFSPPASNQTSPSVSHSLTSPPSQTSMFDSFGPIGSGIHDFIPISSPPDTLNTTQDELGISLFSSDLFHTPLPFEHEMLQSMQSSAVLDDISLPGFNWMSQFQSPDNHTKPIDSTMYDLNTDFLGAY